MDHTVSTSIHLVQNDVNDETTNKKLKFNLIHKEHIAMEELAKKKDLIITNADNGGTVVIRQPHQKS